MSKENPTAEELAAAKSEQENETISKLEEQVANLNKGIAATRDEAKTAIEAAKSATDALDVFKRENAKSKEPDEALSSEDQKKFEAWAKSKGIVTQEELQAERDKLAGDNAKGVANQAVSEFLEKYPEYDEDDEWQKVQAEFNLYKTPTDLAGYRRLLERVRGDLNPAAKADKAKAQARAEINKKAALAKGGGSQGASSTDAEFEAEVDKMQSKYPSLSRGQIEARLSETRALYADKKE
jgi:hypothetical protein